MFLEHWIQNLNKFDVYLLEKHHTLPAYISFNLYIIQIHAITYSKQYETIKE